MHLRHAKTGGLKEDKAMISLLMQNAKHSLHAPDQFAAVKTMITDMMTTLKKEQKDDLKHKEWCEAEFDKTGDKKKETEENIESLGHKATDLEESISTVEGEIATLTKEISDLDTSVAEATAQRKKESAEFTQTMAELSAAVSLLEKAKDKLSSIYAPTMFAQQQKSNQEDPSFSFLGLSFLQMRSKTTSMSDDQAAPPPPPETAAGYQKKTGAGMSIMSMLDGLINDSKSQQQSLKHEEEDSQKDYEELMAESQESRENKAKSISDKESERVRLMEELNTTKQSTTDAKAELKAVRDNIGSLHQSCDFLMENFDVRKEARTSELEGLSQGLAVLNGANFSLAQKRAFLSRLQQ